MVWEPPGHVCAVLRVGGLVWDRRPSSWRASVQLMCGRRCLTPPDRSTIDDPTLLSVLTPLRYFFTEHEHHGVRWTLCAKEMCYRNALLGCGLRPLTFVGGLQGGTARRP